MNNLVEVPVLAQLSYPVVAGGIIGSYVALEVVNHVVLGTWLMPYLSSLGMSATMTGIAFYGLLGAALLGVSYLVYRFLFKPKLATITSVGPVREPAAV